MQITNELFDAFLLCETKFRHIRNGTQPDRSEIVSWQQERREAYRKQYAEKLASEINKIKTGVELSEIITKSRIQVHLDCLFRSDSIISRIDAVQRMSPKKGARSVYTPILFQPNEKIVMNDRLSLAFKALALSRLMNSPPKVGFIIHGRACKRSRVNIVDLMSSVDCLVDEMEDSADSLSEVYPVLSKQALSRM